MTTFLKCDVVIGGATLYCMYSTRNVATAQQSAGITYMYSCWRIDFERHRGHRPLLADSDGYSRRERERATPYMLRSRCRLRRLRLAEPDNTIRPYHLLHSRRSEIDPQARHALDKVVG